MHLCYEYVQKTCGKRFERNSEEIDDLSSDIEEIIALEDFSNTVGIVEIESSLDLYEPMYSIWERFNYYTGTISESGEYNPAVFGSDDEDKNEQEYVMRFYGVYDDRSARIMAGSPDIP